MTTFSPELAQFQVLQFFFCCYHMLRSMFFVCEIMSNYFVYSITAVSLCLPLLFCTNSEKQQSLLILQKKKKRNGEIGGNVGYGIMST